MAESGCKALFVGFESIDEETVRFTGKRQNRPSEYKETIDMLHEHGISVWGSFVFGFDTDDPGGVRSHRRVRDRDEAHDGALRHPDAVSGHARSTAGSWPRGA